MWIAAAAAAFVIVLGGGLLWYTTSPIPPTIGPAEFVQNVFEGTGTDHDLNGDGTIDASDLMRAVISTK